MDFAQYLASDHALSLTEIANRTGVSLGRISQLKRSGAWTPEMALAVEQATDGVVDASQLNDTIKRARSVRYPRKMARA